VGNIRKSRRDDRNIESTVCRPSGTWKKTAYPGINSWAIFVASLRDVTSSKRFSSNCCRRFKMIAGNLRIKSDARFNCLDCGYYLDGLERPGIWIDEYHCPECGRRFFPSNLQSYAIDNPRGRPIRSGSSLLFMSLVGVGLAASVFAFPMARRTKALIFPAGFMTQVLVPMIRSLLQNRDTASVRPVARQRGRGAVIVAGLHGDPKGRTHPRPAPGIGRRRPRADSHRFTIVAARRSVGIQNVHACDIIRPQRPVHVVKRVIDIIDPKTYGDTCDGRLNGGPYSLADFLGAFRLSDSSCCGRSLAY